MTESMAECARGRARPSRSRTQGEANVEAIGEPEDADPATVSGVIRVRVVVESVIYAFLIVMPSRRYATRSAASIAFSSRS
jgi:hypothetical protein